MVDLPYSLIIEAGPTADLASAPPQRYTGAPSRSLEGGQLSLLVRRQEMSVPWSSPMWEGDVTFALGVPSHGWVQLAVLCNAFNQSVIVSCSDVFDPFDDMLKWLREIQAGRLPSSFDVDEEGHGSRFTLSHNSLGNKDAEFTVATLQQAIDGSFALERVSVRCPVDREMIVFRLATTLVQWLKSYYGRYSYGMTGHDDEGGFDLVKRYLAGFQSVASECRLTRRCS